MIDEEIVDLLNESDLEIASDDEDPEYTLPVSRESRASSEDSVEEDQQTCEEDDYQNLSVASQVRGRAQTRGITSSRARCRSSARGRARIRGRVRTRGGARGAARPSTVPSWSRRSFDVPLPNLSQPSYLPSIIQDSSDLLEYFQEYIDDDLLQLIVEKSNQNELFRKGKLLRLTIEELKTFLGITMLMACINYPQIKMYWNHKYAMAIITEAMSRDRYIHLRNSIKIVFDLDITPEMRQNDKLWKVRPLINRVLQGCYAQEREQNISIDEMIIPFTGSCAIRQYCPGKPHPTGLKAFVLANPNGLVCDILVYQGKGTLSESEFSLGESVVLKLTDTLVPGHVIYCDRYFTSIKLIEELNLRGFKCAGTIIKNRIPRHLREDFESDKCLSRRGRGSLDVLVREGGDIAITKWYDNKPVNLLSSIYAANKTDECRRYDRKLKNYVMVQRPEVVKEYNSNMGGVDLTDRLLSVCPARSRTRKWTVRFINHMFDLAVVNAWIKYKMINREEGKSIYKILKLREFKQEIAERLILGNIYSMEEDENENVAEEETRKRGRPSIVPLPPVAKRFHGANHLPDMGSKQKRCRKEGCSKKTTVICIYCNMPLCLTPSRNCFVDFHCSV